MKIRLPRLLRVALLACLATICSHTAYSASLSFNDEQFTSFALSQPLEQSEILERQKTSWARSTPFSIDANGDLTIDDNATEEFENVTQQINTLTLGGTLHLNTTQAEVKKALGSGTLNIENKSLLIITNSELRNHTITIAGASTLRISNISGGELNLASLTLTDAGSNMLVERGNVTVKALNMTKEASLNVSGGSLTLTDSIGNSEKALPDFYGKLTATEDLTLAANILLLSDKDITQPGGSLILKTDANLINKGKLYIGSLSDITANQWLVQGNSYIYGGNVYVKNLLSVQDELTLHGENQYNVYTFGSTFIESGKTVEVESNVYKDKGKLILENVTSANLGDVEGKGSLYLVSSALVVGSLNLGGDLESTLSDNEEITYSSLSVKGANIKGDASLEYLNFESSEDITFLGNVTKFNYTTIRASAKQISFSENFINKPGVFFCGNHMEAQRLQWNTAAVAEISFGVQNTFKFSETIISSGKDLSFDGTKVPHQGNVDNNRSDYGQLGNLSVIGSTNITLKHAELEVSDINFSIGTLKLTDSQLQGEGKFVGTGTNIILEKGSGNRYTLQSSSLDMGKLGSFSLTGGSLTMEDASSLNANTVSLSNKANMTLNSGAKVTAISDLSINGSGSFALTNGASLQGASVSFENIGGNLTLSGAQTIFKATTKGSITTSNTTISLTDQALLDMGKDGTIALANGELSISSSTVNASSISLAERSWLELSGATTTGNISLYDNVSGTISNSTIIGNISHKSTGILSFGETVEITGGLDLISNSQTNITGKFTINANGNTGFITLNLGHLTLGNSLEGIKTNVTANIILQCGQIELSTITSFTGTITMSGILNDSRELLVSKSIGGVHLAVNAQSTIVLNAGVRLALVNLSGTEAINLKGSGELTLDQANAYSGDINWSGNTIYLKDSDALGATGTLNIEGKRQLILTGQKTHQKNLSMSNQTSELILSSEDGDTTTFQGNINLSGTLTKEGAGTVTLGTSTPSDRSYLSDIIVNKGTLNILGINNLSGAFTAGEGNLTFQNVRQQTPLKGLNITQATGTISLLTQSYLMTVSNVRFTQGSLALTGTSTLGVGGAFTLMGTAKLNMYNSSLHTVGTLLISGLREIELTNVTLTAGSTLTFNLRDTGNNPQGLTIYSTNQINNTLQAQINNTLQAQINNTLQAQILAIESEVIIQDAKLSIDAQVNLSANLTLEKSSGVSTLGKINLHSSHLTLEGKGNDGFDRLSIYGSLITSPNEKGEVHLTYTDFIGDVGLNHDKLFVTDSTIAGGSITLTNSSITLSGTNSFNSLSLSGENSILSLNAEAPSLTVTDIYSLSGVLTVNKNITLNSNLWIQGNSTVYFSGSLIGDLQIQAGSLTLKEGSSVEGTLFFSGSTGIDRTLVVTGNSSVSSMHFGSQGIIQVEGSDHILTITDSMEPENGNNPSSLTKTGAGTLHVSGSGKIGDLFVTQGTFTTDNHTTNKQTILFTGNVNAYGDPNIVGGTDFKPTIYLKNNIVHGALHANDGGSITMEGGQFLGGLNMKDDSLITLKGVKIDLGQKVEFMTAQQSHLSILEGSEILFVGEASIAGTLTMKDSKLLARNDSINFLSEKGRAYVSDSTLQSVNLIVGNPATQANFINSIFTISGKTEIRGEFRLYAINMGPRNTPFDFGTLGTISIQNGATVTFGLGYTETRGTESLTFNSTEAYQVAGKLTVADNGADQKNTFNMKQGTFIGDIFVEGQFNSVSFQDSTINGNLNVEGGFLTFMGDTTVSQKVYLGAETTIVGDSTFTATEMHITGSCLEIAGTLNAELILDGGNAILNGENAKLTKSVTIKDGSFTYLNSILDRGTGNVVTFAGSQDAIRTFIIKKSISIDALNLLASGTVSLTKNFTLTMRGALLGEGNLYVIGEGNTEFTQAAPLYSGDIHYDAVGKFYLTENDALGKGGTLFIGQNTTSSVQAHAFIQGSHSKNVVGENVLLTTTGKVIWDGNIIQKSTEKDGAYLITIGANGSSIGTLIVTEGGFTSLGGNRFTDITARSKDGALMTALITLNQGDTINGLLTTTTNSKINLIGISSNLKQVTNAGTFRLSGSANITVVESFASSGSVLLENSSLRILKDVSVSGSISTVESNTSASFQANNLIIIGVTGSLNLAAGINTLRIDGNLTMQDQAQNTSIRGTAIVGAQSEFIGGSFTLDAIGDGQSNLGRMMIKGDAKVTLKSSEEQMIQASYIGIEGNSLLTLDGVQLSLSSGSGNMEFTGSTDASAPKTLVEINNSSLSGHIIIHGFNNLNIATSFNVSGNLQINNGALHLAHPQNSAGGKLIIGGDVSLSLDGIESAQLNVTEHFTLQSTNFTIGKNSSAIVNGQILLSGTSLVYGDLVLSTNGDSHDFGSLSSMRIEQGGFVSITGHSAATKALLTSNISLEANVDVINSLRLSNISLKGNVSMAGDSSLLTMVNSIIQGDLLLNGGAFGASGNNKVETASLSGNTQINILTGTFQAKTVRLIESATMEISSKLDSNLSLAGKDTSATLKGNGSISGNLTIDAGEFIYQSGSLGGKIVFNSTYGEGIITVNDDWTIAHNIDMQSYGIITVADTKTLTIDAALTNKGTLMMSGAGNFKFSMTGTHSGNLVFDGTGHLILEAKDALGASGSLSLSQASQNAVLGVAYIDVMADQAKSIISTSAHLMMTAVKNDGPSVIWKGTLDLDKLTLKNNAQNQQSHFTLASKGSIIESLVLENSVFISNGGNQFGNIDLKDSGNMTLSVGDTISGITTSIASTITLNGVVTTMQILDNQGNLYLKNKASITVADNAKLQGFTEFLNSSLTVGGTTTITQTVQTNTLNMNSSLTTGNLDITGEKGQLLMETGISSISVTGNFTLSEDVAASSIRGYLSIGDNLIINVGSLTLTVAGEKISSLGTVLINTGTLSLISDGKQGTVLADTITINSGGSLSLKNINLDLSNGSGLLMINGTDDADASSLLEVADSTIRGNVLLTKNNVFVVDRDTQITGSLTINGALTLQGNGVLSMQNLTLGNKEASTTVSGSLHVSNKTTLNGGHMDLTSAENNHSFGELGDVLLNLKSTLNISGVNTENKATLTGNIILDAKGMNSLAMSHTVLTGNVTLNKSDIDNTFTMTDSEIIGRLTIKGGIFNVVGFNTVTEANISGNTSMNIANGATFKAETTVVQPEGNLNITGTLDGALLLEGGNATLNGSNANITKNVHIISGELTLTQTSSSPIGGKVTLQGNSIDAAQIVINQNWTMNQALVMDGNGSLILNQAFILNGTLSGEGRLDITGTGALSLNTIGSHTGDIYFNSTGLLTVGADYALGTSGTLHLESDNASLSIKDVQSKKLRGKKLSITTQDNVLWSGTMNLSSLTLNGQGLTLGITESSIETLILESGAFTSMGGNTFGNVHAQKGSATFKQKDNLTGNVMIDALAKITFDGVVSTVTSVKNIGTLELNNLSNITVSHDFESKGSLALASSSLNVLGSMSVISTASLHNSTLKTSGILTIQGTMQTATGNVSSTLNLNNIIIADGGTINMNEGINIVTVSNNLTVQTGGNVTIRGSLSVQGISLLDGGTMSVTAMGNIISSLGSINVHSGYLSLSGGDADHRAMNALSLQIENQAAVSFANVQLTLNEGKGNLTLNGGTLSFSGNSTIDGNMIVNANNTFSLADQTTVTGNMTLTQGCLEISGTSDSASLSIGKSLSIAKAASIRMTNLNLNLQGASSIQGNLSLISTLESGFDLGYLGQFDIVNAAVFSATGVEGHQATLAGTMTLRSTSSTSLDQGSKASLENILYTGSIFVSADYNTLTLKSSTIKGNVTLAGSQNLFNMSNSTINGMLDIGGGEVQLDGANFADSASISGNANVSIKAGASLGVETTVVKPQGSLTIAGQLIGALLLNGNNASATLESTAFITSNVTVTLGTLTNYAERNDMLGGELHFNGANLHNARVFVKTKWELSHAMVMSGYGSLELYADMSLGKALSGTGRLDVTGTGAFTLSATSDYTGDVYYSSTGRLTLGMGNALGQEGTLHMSRDNVFLQVTGDQHKGLAGSCVTMTSTNNLTWVGKINLRSLTLEGSDVTLGAQQSTLNNLILNSGNFTSMGSNSFGDVHAVGGNATFNTGDLLTGNLIVGTQDSTGIEVTVNSVLSTLKNVTNYNRLLIANHSNLIVSGKFISSGFLSITGNSSLTVTGNLALTDTQLHNGSLSTDSELTINGSLVTATGNTESHLNASSMVINMGGSLQLNEGLNSLRVIDTLLMNGGTTSIKGSLMVGTSTTLDGGTLSLTLAGSTASALGTVVVNNTGTLNLLGNDKDHRSISAGSMKIAQGGTVNLDNVYLALNDSNGMLQLDGGSLTFINNSVLKGNMDVTGEVNSLEFTDHTEITGNVHVKNGTFTMSGDEPTENLTASLVIGGNFTVAKGAKVIADRLILDIKSSSTVSGEFMLNIKSPEATAFNDFGNIGNMKITSGGTFSVAGSLSTTSNGFTGTLLRGNITLTSTTPDEVNTLTLSDIYLTGDVSMDKAGSGNIFNMSHVHINGNLMVQSGTLNLSGENYAEQAYINTKNANLIEKDGTLKVKTAIVMADGHLEIGGETSGSTSTLDGVLWLSDGGTATLNAGGTITKNVNIEEGGFTYNGGSVLGNIVMEGDTQEIASIVLNQNWSAIHSLNMKNYGSINLNGHDLSINGGTADGEAVLLGTGLAGNAELTINGEGTLTINVTGTHTGDIAFDGSELILTANNALGTKGSLNIATTAHIKVSADQYKGLVGMSANMETTNSVNWWGVVQLKQWTINGDLNLGSTGSSIVSLIVSGGTFTTKEKGSNNFGSIETSMADVAIILNQNDKISKSITSVEGSSITLNGVQSEIKKIDNDGSLILQDKTTLSVSGDVNTTGSITLVNSGLSATGTMNLHQVTTGTGNTGSSLVSHDMNITGDLNMAQGTNSIAVNNTLDISGNAVLNGSLQVGGDLTISGDLTLTLGGTTKSDLGNTTVEDEGKLTINGEKKTVQADSITVDGGGELVINNSTVELGEDGLMLEGSQDNIAKATIKDSTIKGDVTTKGQDTELTLSTASITGDLTVNGGILNLEGKNQVGGSATIQEKAIVNVKDGATLESGVISLAPDGSLTVENGGSLGNSSISFGGGNGTQTVTFEGNHTLTGSITMDANGEIKAITEGTLTLSGDLKGKEGTLSLTTDSNSKIIINQGNAAFSGDVTLDGNLVLAANDALGTEGVLTVMKGSTVAVDNNRNGLGTITIAKHITGHTLNLITNNNTVLSGNLGGLQNLIKNDGANGSKNLTLSGNGSVQNFDLQTGTATINGITANYTMGTVNVGQGTELNISGESTLKGLDDDSKLVSAGNTTVKNATLDMDVDVVDGGSLSLNDNAIFSGNVSLQNGSLNLIGSGIKLDDSVKIILDDRELEANRTINVQQSLDFMGQIVVNADADLKLSTGKTLTVFGSIIGDATLKIEGNASLVLKEANQDFEGTLSLGDRVHLVGESSGAFGNDLAIVKINGDRTQIVTGTENSLETLIFENTLDSNGKTFELKTLHDTIWKGALSGTGTMDKTGEGSLVLNNKDNALENTMKINVQEGALILGATIAGNIVMGGSTVLSGYGGTTGNLVVGTSFGGGKEAIIEVGTRGSLGQMSSIKMQNLTLGSNCRYIVDVDLNGTNADILNASGTVSLSGATIEFRTAYLTLEDELNLATGSRWTVITAAGAVTGQLNANVDHNLSYHTVGIEYVDGRVDLVLHLNYRGENAMHIDGNILTNQTFISNVLTHISYNNPGGVMGDVLDNLENIYGEEEIKKAVESIGGVTLTSLMQAQIARANNHMRIMNTGVESPQWKAAVTPHTVAWIQGTADQSEIKGDGNGAGYKRNATGGSVGVEHVLQPINAVVGMAFSYDWETWTSLDNKNKNNTGFLDFFLRKDKAQWHHYGLIGLAQSELDTSRTVAFGSYYNTSNANTNAYSMYADYELAFDVQETKNSTLQILGEIQAGYNTIDGYTETGSIGNAGLNIESQNAMTMELGLGVRYHQSFSSFFNDAPQASYSLKAMFTYDAGDINADTKAAFISDPSTRFTMNPAEEKRYGALFGANISMPYNNNTSFYAGGTYEFKSNAHNTTGTIGVMYAF